MSISNLDSYSPYKIEEGIFGTTVMKEGKPIYLRMEALTEKNSPCWRRFQDMSLQMANTDNRGILGNLIAKAGTTYQYMYADIKEHTGFTSEEYDAFIQKAVEAKMKTDDKIVKLINSTCEGIRHMSTYYIEKEQRYIVYASKNPHFSILNVDHTKPKTLKHFQEAYGDILISVGANFKETNSFHMRGISRNSMCIFEGEGTGLSMALLAFPAVIAEKFFPEKKQMEAIPLSSMGLIIQKYLLPGEGYVTTWGNKIDITELKIAPGQGEHGTYHIQNRALKRIFKNWQIVDTLGF